MSSPGAGPALLSDLERLRSLDRGRMLEILDASADRIRDASEIGRRFDAPVAPAAGSVVVAGLGGSAIGGEVVQSLVAGQCPVPFLVNREYRMPRFVGSDTLVVACSYSGNTAETLSAYRSARERGARLAAITSGGELARQAASDGVPVLQVPGGSPPRTAIAYSVFPLLWLLRRAGLGTWPEEEVEEAASVVADLCGRYGAQAPVAENAAKQVALQLHGKLPVIYAASHPLAAVATRWKGQLCENAKSLALHNVLPEMAHNEIVGWKHAGGISSAQVVCLRDREEHAQVAAAFEFLAPHLASLSAGVSQHWSSGDSLLARVFSLIVLGDYASVYLAFLYGEDPTPVTVIDQLKQALKGAG